MGVLNIGTLTDIEKSSYVREALEIARPQFIYQQFGQGDRVKKREGKTRQWFRFRKLPLANQSGDFSGTLYGYVKNATGVSPTWTPYEPSTATVTATVSFLFGVGHQWNEGVQYTSLADLPKGLRVINHQQAAEAVETEVLDVVKAGTTVAYANAKASRNLLDGADKIDMADVMTQVTTLRNNDAKPIKGLYRAMCSANVIEQLMQDGNFMEVVRSRKDYYFTGTIAELFAVGFQFSSMAPKVADSGSNNALSYVEQTIITGANAYGITKWMLNDYDLVYTPPGGWGDEWKNKHGLAWKHAFKAVILNQNWILRLESAR